jgi:uncharacterized protein
MLETTYKEKLLRALEYHFPGVRVYLFGSRAVGTAQIGADVDIAIDTGEKIFYREMYRARQTIEGLNIPYKVDLVDIHSVSEEMKQNILEQGIIWKN